MSIFREYDIRGIVEKDLTVELAEKIGRAYGSRAVRAGAKAIAVGRDGRTSAPVMREALLKGLLGCGLDVVDIGICPTPLLYFALFTLPVGGGVMITASHNPPEYNGFKLCLGKDSLHGAAIQSLQADIERGRFESGQGRVSAHAIIPDYLAYIKKAFAHVRADRLHVVVDCGNGMGGLVGPDSLRTLGCRVTGLYEEVDGRFPNHQPDPTVVANLQDVIRKVGETGADVGIAYDGDADRIGAVDEKGQILWGDKLMVLFSRDILKEKPGATIISEVKASQVFYDDVGKSTRRWPASCPAISSSPTGTSGTMTPSTRHAAWSRFSPRPAGRSPRCSPICPTRCPRRRSAWTVPMTSSSRWWRRPRSSWLASTRSLTSMGCESSSPTAGG